MQPSDEATAEQLQVARDEGDAYQVALRAMARESGMQTRTAGDYLIGVVVTDAEGVYAPAGELNGLAWHEPEAANAHLEVAVADRYDGRFVPGLDVTARIRAAQAVVVVERVLPFLWHPFFYHYGANLWVEEEGTYTVDIRIAPPRFHRHDPINGRRYVDPVEVSFPQVHITPGVKHSRDAKPYVTRS